ncbi:GMC family oxidoreductase [Alteromonas sp. ASW11-36]|uniref:GMC family oxidoreductase n=1 Tax=Alteromonas arenosi TaxID=3055817 RepID=A0ABT7SVG2_9ALTE|nr:GMC family oxidoreductase [Alteromonas sp. ASW11-36]MDM7860185.1 GMC family oxidoreductase [Alteromonas sp. ASW11-36]
MQLNDIFITDTREEYDVIIVGSGVTGGWAAKEFTERGFKTLMIERGRKVEHRKDYPTEGKGPWEFPERTKVNNLLIEQQYKQQSRSYAFNDTTKHFFGNDRDLPYSTAEGTDFNWIRGNQLGGKSLTWHRQSYRMSEFDFNANKADGHGNDWPIRYTDLKPWYSYVEQHAGISGNRDGLPQLPDSESLPPFEMNSVEKEIQRQFAQIYPDRPMVIGRCAHLSVPTEYHMQHGRVMCQARDECQKGCSFGAYFSTQSSTLPFAAATGNLSIAVDSIVHSLIYDEATNRVRGVRVIDDNDLSTREYFAKVVFMCASTLGTTQIMLNSTSKAFPNGIANSSGVLGHYLMDHCYNAGAGGFVEGYEDEYTSGRRPTGIYVPNFQYEPSRYKKHYVRGYALGGGASRGDWRGKAHGDGIGADFKTSLTRLGSWYFGLYAQGEMLPRFENQVSLHPTKKDKWGMPQLHFNVSWSENERLMMEDCAQECEGMLKKIGVQNINSFVSTDHNPPGSAIHELGTARMGRDKKESVLNGYNQCHDIPNLFVTDGASYCSSATVNPSLTFMALTVRAVDYCAKEMQQRRI